MIENQLEAAKKKIYLGFSKKYTLYDSGCLVHCVARLLEKPVLEVHEKLKSASCFFADETGDICLLDLAKVPQAYPELIWVGKETVWDQDKALATIAQSGGLIVGVDYNPSQAGIQSHFVFFHGNGEIEDPLGAKVRPTNYYPIISMRIFRKIISPPQEENMTDEQKRLLDLIMEKGLTEGDIRWVADLKRNETVPKLEKKVDDLNKEITIVNAKLAELEAKFVENQKINSNQQKELTTANKDILELNQTIENITGQSNDWQRRYNSKNEEFNQLKKEFEEYQKTHTEVKFNLFDFIKSLFIKK